jgi:predicted RNA binding protein YcfA (HicA-like mRNA interferase family)
LKRKEFIRYLTHNGCLLHREGKKHTIYINPDKKLSSAVPRHQEIDDKLARKICRDLGIEKI